jgi:hypothetical protein
MHPPAPPIAEESSSVAARSNSIRRLKIHGHRNSKIEELIVKS